MAAVISLNPLSRQTGDQSNKGNKGCGQHEAGNDDGYGGGFHGYPFGASGGPL